MTATITRTSETTFSVSVSGTVTKGGTSERGFVNITQGPYPGVQAYIGETKTGTIYTGTTYTIEFVGKFGSEKQLSVASGLTWPAYGDEAQTVTISPSSVTVKAGESRTFTASGGHNGYEWNLTGGGTLATSGATALFIASTAGTWTVSVSSPGGSGYAPSNTATAAISVSLANRVRVSLKANNGSWPVEYVVMQDGEEVATYVQMPGASARIVSQVVSGTGPVTVLSRQVGLHQEENGNWTVNPDGAGPVTTSPEITPEATEEPAPVEVTPPPGPTAPAPTEGDQSHKPVWSSVSMNSNPDPNNQTDLLTNSTFREGVDKQVEHLGSIKVVMDQMKNDGADAKEAGEGWMNGGAVSAFWAGAQDKIAAMAATDADKITEHQVTSIPTVALTKASTLSLGSDIDSGLVNGVFKLEPFAIFPWLEPMLTVIREIVLWGMGWMFYAAAQAKLERIQFALSLVPQADVEPGEKIQILGNYIPGSASAISLLKRVIVAGVMIGTIHIQFAVCVVALNTRLGSLFGSGFSITNIGSIVATVAGSAPGPMSTAFRAVDTVFPVVASIAFIGGWIVFGWACMVTYATASAALKAVKI